MRVFQSHFMGLGEGTIQISWLMKKLVLNVTVQVFSITNNYFSVLQTHDAHFCFISQKAANFYSIEILFLISLVTFTDGYYFMQYSFFCKRRKTAKIF